MSGALAILFLIVAAALAFCCWILHEAVHEWRRRALDWKAQWEDQRETAFVYYQSWQDAIWGRVQHDVPAELYDRDRQPGWRTPT